MNRWKLTYELRIFFSEPVSCHSYSLRCFPGIRKTQDIRSCICRITPCSGPQGRDRDSFGNSVLYGRIEEGCREFRVRVEAKTAVREGPEPEPSAWQKLGMYRYQTPYTRPGETIREFYAKYQNHLPEVFTPWERADVWMEALADQFVYQSGSTDAGTTAEQAFAQGCGVCQDYAQILLSLLREEGITARYTAGTVPGEGETHAWVEVWQDGYWRGFDPTNNRRTDASYLVFAVGRDAWDCGLNRGVFRGNAAQEKQVYVKMEEMEHGQDDCGGIPSGDGEAEDPEKPADRRKREGEEADQYRDGSPR